MTPHADIHFVKTSTKQRQKAKAATLTPKWSEEPERKMNTLQHATNEGSINMKKRRTL